MDEIYSNWKTSTTFRPFFLNIHFGNSKHDFLRKHRMLFMFGKKSVKYWKKQFIFIMLQFNFLIWKRNVRFWAASILQYWIELQKWSASHVFNQRFPSENNILNEKLISLSILCSADPPMPSQRCASHFKYSILKWCKYQTTVFLNDFKQNRVGSTGQSHNSLASSYMHVWT